MKYLVILSPDAHNDISLISAQYSEESAGLAVRFEASLEAALIRIGTYPYAAPRVGPGLRRSLLSKFPYSVYYTVIDKLVFVVAVVHQHRRSPFWWN